MKTIIAGSRNFTPTQSDWEFLDSLQITEVVCGGARGADEFGRVWAIQRNIPVAMFPAKWGEYGKAAGFIRNKDMAEYGERLVAFWNGLSSGTKNMIGIATRLGLEVHVRTIADEISESNT